LQSTAEAKNSDVKALEVECAQ